MAAPYGAALLADLGAEVIKVEKPRRGDLIRHTEKNVRGESGYYLGLNRGKRGITVDLRTAEGQEIVRRLAGGCDVIIENYRPGTMQKWGLGYDELSAINPRLVYCSLSMFPDDVAGFDHLVGNDKTAQAISGLMDNTGEPTGPPTRLGAPIVDAAGGFPCAIAILAAIVGRVESGIGDHVKLSLLESAYALMPPWIPSLLNNPSVEYSRNGHKHPLLAPYQLFKTSDDRYMVIGAFHNGSWRRLCEALDREDLLDDPRFRENDLRVRHRDVLDPIIEQEVRRRPAAALQERLDELGVPAAPVLSIRESLDQFTQAAPQLIDMVTHKAAGEVRMLRPPIRAARGRPAQHAAPALSESTDEVLSTLGYSDHQVRDLRRRGVI